MARIEDGGRPRLQQSPSALRPQGPGPRAERPSTQTRRVDRYEPAPTRTPFHTSTPTPTPLPTATPPAPSTPPPAPALDLTSAGGGAPLQLNAHAMVLAAYDPTHLDHAGNPAPWGFINSWADGGSELYWMPDADFQQAWDHDIPLAGSHNAVVITREPAPAASPQPSDTPTPGTTTTATATPVPVRTPEPGSRGR